jgi:SpoVK/Ycf46/Vps4 family AAA+-type ATPase
MFREAKTAGAVLLLDEADSFLRDRREARSAWEVTQVNELLVQMECFDGVFIVSTNLFESLDAAALRRFDLKVRFDYLRPEQAWTLFRETLRQSGARLTQPAVWQARLERLERLTPGDFAAVVRRQRLAPERLSAQGLLNALRAEVETSGRVTSRSIGFSVDL